MDRVFMQSVLRRILVLSVVFLVASCGGSQSTNPPAKEITPAIGVSQTSAGRLVQVSDFVQQDCASQTISIQVGGEDAPVVIQADGSIEFFAPLFFDEALQWNNPPAEALDVEYFCNDAQVAINSSALTVTALQK